MTPPLSFATPRRASIPARNAARRLAPIPVSSMAAPRVTWVEVTPGVAQPSVAGLDPSPPPMIPQAATTLVRPLIAITLTAAFSRRGRKNGISPRFPPTNTVYLSVIFRPLRASSSEGYVPVDRLSP
ncbi:hypothetical protein FRAHR75_680054 [Frankia sp. Hr75.2]|nr:hypothetical protein FRAHR75_680054 [Frankia sp. Hr75.2]